MRYVDSMEWLGRLRFYVHYQGIIKSNDMVCFDCAESILGLGPDEGTTMEWNDSPATGGRLVRLSIYNKGGECCNPGTVCPICQLQINEGAETSFTLWRVDDHDQTFEEVMESFKRDNDYLEEQAAHHGGIVDPDDEDYDNYVWKQFEAALNMIELMKL